MGLLGLYALEARLDTRLGQRLEKEIRDGKNSLLLEDLMEVWVPEPEG